MFQQAFQESYRQRCFALGQDSQVGKGKDLPTGNTTKNFYQRTQNVHGCLTFIVRVSSL